MPYQFLVSKAPVLQEALAIAMNYLACTRQAYPYSETERICVYAIYNEWKTGRRDRIWLSNKAIVAIEQAKQESRAIQVIPIASSGSEGC